MPGRQQGQWTLKERIIAEIRHDPKKTVVLSVLFLVAGFLVLRQLSGGSPEEASARTPKVRRVQSNQPSPAVSVESERDRQARNLRREYLEAMDREIRRDLFVVDVERFCPVDGDKPKPVELTPEQREQLRRKKITEAAGRLVVESTMVGASPTAMINGRIYRVGDRVDGFEIQAIGPRSCTVEKDDVRVVLQMK